jgi:hypothetical protein
MKYIVTYYFDDNSSSKRIYKSKSEMEDAVADNYLQNDVTDIEIKELIEPKFVGEEKKIFEFGKKIRTISDLKQLPNFRAIDTPERFVSVIQFFEVNGYNERLIDLLYKWEPKTETSGWFERARLFFEKYKK